MTPCFRILAAVSALIGLTACGPVLTESASDAAGVAAAGVSSAVTRNGAITAAIGLGAESAAASGLAFAERRMHRVEQNEIAEAAGPLPVGAVASWSVSHDIPIEPDERGEVSVSRLIGDGDLACKEIVFSIDRTAKTGLERAFYVTTICKDGAVWKWALAEPSTARWSMLQ